MLTRSFRYVYGFSAGMVLLACALAARPASAQPPFPVCFVAIQFTSYTVPVSGGDLQIRVLVEPPFCGGWNTSVSDSWINITSGRSGSFDGTINVSIAPNTGAARSGVLTVIGGNNSVPITISQAGTGDDQPVTGDFDGDGRTDLGFFRPTTGQWFLKNSRTGAATIVVWGGSSGDRAVPADYDGDGRADLAFFREADGYWYILGSRDGPRYEFWPAGAGAVLAPADYDGDRRTDVAFFRPGDGFWYILESRRSAPRYEAWGISGDTPTPADYDGDGAADVALFRRTDGYWYILLGMRTPWYLDWRVPPGGTIAKGDFDGDGRADVGFFNPSDNFWYLVTQLGRATMYVASGQPF